MHDKRQLDRVRTQAYFYPEFALPSKFDLIPLIHHDKFETYNKIRNLILCEGKLFLLDDLHKYGYLYCHLYNLYVI